MVESAKNVDQLIKYYSESPMNKDSINFGKYCGDIQVSELFKRGFELKGILGYYLKKQNLKKGQTKFIEDSEGVIDYFCLRDANEYFNKALYLMCCYKYLQMGGYHSWAKVTFYYPRFYLNNSLCRLQGYSLFHGSPRIELFRENWSNRVYAYRQAKMNGPHVHLWETAKEYYKEFDSTGLISLDNDGIKSFFNDEFLKEIGIDTPSRTELDWRNEITYGATKFEELYWGNGNAIYSFSRGEGIYNYIDSEVFYKEFSNDDYGGEGLEEYNMGILIKFIIELLGKISNKVHNPNLCHIKMKSLRHFETNDDFLSLIEEWAKEYGLSCNEKIYRDE
jgi:hypothetical protein